MNIKVRTNISEKYEDIEININSPIRNEQVQKIENYLLSVNEQAIQKIIGMQRNNIFIINVLDVIMFYGKNKSILCKTNSGIYRIKETLYYNELYAKLQDIIEETKSKNGENFPAEEIVMLRLLNSTSTSHVVYTFSLTLLIGTILGTAIYIMYLTDNIYVFQINTPQILIPFLVILAVTHIINLVYQKTLANKLNQKLRKA